MLAVMPYVDLPMQATNSIAMYVASYYVAIVAILQKVNKQDTYKQKFEFEKGSRDCDKN